MGGKLPGIVLQLSPEGPNRNAQVVEVLPVGRAPDFFQQAFVCHHPSGAIGKRPQKVELARGQINALAADLDHVGVAVDTAFAELYARLSGTVGPVSLTARIAYAPKQQALGNVFFTGAAAAAGLADDQGDKEDNLYLSRDAAHAIADTPLTLKAHIGYSDGNPGLGPNGTTPAAVKLDRSVASLLPACLNLRARREFTIVRIILSTLS
jgi:hypothetical protein